MRIAIFHDLPSGGAKRTLYEITRRLVPRHHVDLYSLSTADERFCDLRPLVRAHRQIPYVPSRLFGRPFGRLNQLQRRRDLARLAELGRGLAATIDAQAYDVVLAEPSQWTQAPPLLSYLATPSIYDFHEPPRALYEPEINQRGARSWRRLLDRVDPLPQAYRALARQVDRNATRAAGRVLVNSHFTGAQLRRIYDVEPRVVYHGVDVEHFRPGGPPEGRRREVLSVGSVQPGKGFDFVIQALAEIPESQRPALRIVGNAEVAGERGFLTCLAERLGVALAIEIGLDDAQLARRYAEAALLVYAPHREPFGLVTLEAMASATPVVAVAEGGVRESVQHEVTGLLVERQSGPFADAVRRLLDDPAARERLGANAREAVCCRWTWDLGAARFESELCEMLHGGVAPAAREAGA